ncbi:hypothetical protein Tco_0893788 [Tanacetum coccineum]|uniref:Uncharacterized protein n=1 Tax=Tanacetum coccineum TaxID=301880 RepID=A0ABQ5CD41_9ASTR
MGEPETIEQKKKEDEELTNAAKPDAEKSAQEEGDVETSASSSSQVKESTVFPIPSSSVSVSSGFDTQFFNSSSDISLTGILKDTTKADFSSLMDITIQQETPQIQSPSVLKVPMTVIPKTTNLPLIQEILSDIPVSTAVSSPQVTLIISPVQQTTIPIPTPLITTDAPTITTAVPESDALMCCYVGLDSVQYGVSNGFDTAYQGFLGVGITFDIFQNIHILYLQYGILVFSGYGVLIIFPLWSLVSAGTDTDVFQKELKKHTTDLIQKYSVQQTPQIKKEQAEMQKMPKFTIKSTNKAALEECDLKSALYQIMHANKSFNRNPGNYKLYRALLEALIEDESAIDKGVADTIKDHKRKHDGDEDDDDEDPLAGPNQVEEPIAEVVMDDTGEDVVRDADQSQDSSKPKKDKTPEWFKQPPRPPTPDLKWNKR